MATLQENRTGHPIARRRVRRARGKALSTKYFKQFANRSTFQEYSVQISDSISP